MDKSNEVDPAGLCTSCASFVSGGSREDVFRRSNPKEPFRFDSGVIRDRFTRFKFPEGSCQTCGFDFNAFLLKFTGENKPPSIVDDGDECES